MSGKYDHECDALIKRVDAEMAIVAVGGGNRGSGFSISIDRERCPCMRCMLSAIIDTLRAIADQVEGSEAAQLPHEHGGANPNAS